MEQQTKINLNLEDKAIRKVLPDGLSIQVSQQWKTYAWNHATVIGDGDPTLNGLLKFAKKAAALPPLASPKMQGLGEVTEEQAKAISQNYHNLPELLSRSGFVVLDEKREQFIRTASAVKAQMAKTYLGRTIPSSEMKRYDDLVNQHQFKGVEVIVRGFVVTTDNPKGSRQRKSDGKFVTERILRRVIIDKPLSDVQLQKLLEAVVGPLIKTMTRAAEYTVRFKGRDRGGNNVIEVTMTSVANPTKTRPKPKS